MKNKSVTIIIVLICLLLISCTKSSIEPLNNPDNEKIEQTEDIILYGDGELVGELIIAIDSAPQNMYGPFLHDEEHLANLSYTPIVNKIIQFMDKHPKVKVKIQFTRWDQQTKRNSDIELPDFSVMPDIIELTPHQVRWSASDDLENLAFYLDNLSGDLLSDAEYRALLSLSEIDLATYILPIRSDPLVVYYAASILEDLEIDLPTEHWTWSDFFHTVKQVYEAGYAHDDLIKMANIEHIINALGGQYMSLEETEFAGFMDSELTWTAFQSYMASIGVHAMALASETDPHVILNRLPPAFGLIRASEWLNFTEDLTTHYNKRYGIGANFSSAVMPRTAEGTPNNTTLVTGLAMSKQSPNKALAWELMRFIVDESDGGAQPIEFVAYNTLAGGSLKLAQGQLEGETVEQAGKLLQLIRSETVHSRVSSLSMYPRTLGGKADDVYEVPWQIPNDGDLQHYLSQFAQSLDSIRDEMIERGLGKR